MTAPTPAEELRAAAQRIRAYVAETPFAAKPFLLAVADWLEQVSALHGIVHMDGTVQRRWAVCNQCAAEWMVGAADGCPDMVAALAVARAFLGTTP